MKKQLFLLFILVCFSSVSCSNSSFNLSNPFVEYDTKAEAENAIGFSFSVPDAIQLYEKPIYRISKHLNMYEIIFNNDNDGNQIVYRKAKSNEDVSGDYNEYKNVDTFVFNDISITIKHDETEYFLATWFNDGFSYSYSVKLGQDENNFYNEIKDMIESN